MANTVWPALGQETQPIGVHRTAQRSAVLSLAVVMSRASRMKDDPRRPGVRCGACCAAKFRSPKPAKSVTMLFVSAGGAAVATGQGWGRGATAGRVHAAGDGMRYPRLCGEGMCACNVPPVTRIPPTPHAVSQSKLAAWVALFSCFASVANARTAEMDVKQMVITVAYVAGWHICVCERVCVALLTPPSVACCASQLCNHGPRVTVLRACVQGCVTPQRYTSFARSRK